MIMRLPAAWYRLIGHSSRIGFNIVGPRSAGLLSRPGTYDKYRTETGLQVFPQHKMISLVLILFIVLVSLYRCIRSRFVDTMVC